MPYIRKNKKAAVIGAGFAGASIAYAMNLLEIADEIVLIDINPDKAHSEAADIRHGVPFMGGSIVYSGTFSECRDCDLIIITAGRNRRKDESRLNLAEENSLIMRKVADSLIPHYNKGAILIVSNPVDIMTYCFSSWMALPAGRVFGTGCLLDTSRLVFSISDYLGVGTDAVSASVAGEHGDTQFPLWSRVSVAGLPIEEYCFSEGIPWGQDKREAIEAHVRKMGASIIAVKGRTQYGIATCVCYLAKCIINNLTITESVCSVFAGEYGIEGAALSVPSLISSSGVLRRLEESWNDDEINKLRHAADVLRKTLTVLNIR